MAKTLPIRLKRRQRKPKETPTALPLGRCHYVGKASWYNQDTEDEDDESFVERSMLKIKFRIAARCERNWRPVRVERDPTVRGSAGMRPMFCVDVMFKRRFRPS